MVGIIGIGNPLAGDDGVGIESVRLLQNILSDERVQCMTCERGGLDLLDMMTGRESVLIVDASRTGHCPPGTVTVMTVRRPFPSTGTLSLHTIDLQALLGFGTMIGMQLPDEVTVYAIETTDTDTFREGCTPDVRLAIAEVIRGITGHLQQILKGDVGISPGSSSVEEKQSERPSPTDSLWSPG